MTGSGGGSTPPRRTPPLAEARARLSHLRQPGGVRRAVTLRVSAHRAFVDLAPDYRRSLYLTGSRRSGTSWLAQVLSERYRCRFVLEPLRADHVPGARWFTYGRYLDPDEAAPETRVFAERVLSGRLRSVWSDRENTVRVARRRVVKDVWQNPLVPWLARQFPEMPIVYILRHPLACASSAAGMGWDLYFESLLGERRLFAGPLADVADRVVALASDPDPVVPHVARWCVENLVLVRMLDPGRVVAVFFEDLVQDPSRELARIDRYLAGHPLGGWRVRSGTTGGLDRPSLSDYRQARREAEGADRLTMWTRELPAPTVDRCLEIVEAFGLGHLYGPEPGPAAHPDQILTASRLAS